MKRTLALVALLALVLCCFAGCGNGKSATEPMESNTETTPTTTDVTANFDLNPLTGEYDLEKGAANRPIGIMIANDSSTTGNQAGIDKADFIMECETEGAIPRLLAVFANASRVPEKLGPVRSARSPFIATARAMDIIYCHAGGSVPAKATLKSSGMDHFDALADSKTFWRDDVLKSKMDFVHSVATSGKKLTAKVENSGMRTTLEKKMPYSFGEKTGDITATNVQLKTTPSRKACFIYDSATGLYTKNNGFLEGAKPHKSLEGNAIAVKNVLVIYAEKYIEETYSNGTNICNFRDGSGTAYLANNGTARKIRFTRSGDSLTLFEEDGSKAVLAPGKIYMCLVSDQLESSLSFS